MPITAQGRISKDIINGIAITSFIFALSVYIPIFGLIVSLLIPLPILFYRSKLGRTTGIIIPAMTIIIMIIVLGGISIDILFFIELLILGFILSELIELNLSIEKTILYACSVVFFTTIVALLFYSNISNTAIKPLVSEYVAKNLQLTMILYQKMGVSEENIQVILNSLENIQYVLVRIIPALAITSTLFVAWTNLMLAKPILKKKNFFYPDFGALTQWKAPEFLVWGVIGSGLLLLYPDKAFKMLGLNGLIVLMMIYFFHGIAIVSFYFEKKQFPRLLRLFLYSLIALQQVVLLFVIGLGFFDMWLNFRRLEINKKNS